MKWGTMWLRSPLTYCNLADIAFWGYSLIALEKMAQSRSDALVEIYPGQETAGLDDWYDESRS